MEKTSKKSRPRLQLVIAIMIMAVLFLAELYVMINESNNIVLVVGIAILILIALYFVIDAVLDCLNEKDIADREQYDSIYRSEKASYMLLKKNLEELSKQVKAINNGTDKKSTDSAEIIKSQKAIAKVAMSKTNETQDRLFIELNNLEASLKDSIGGLSDKLSGFQEEIERLADHIARINEEAILAASKNVQETSTLAKESMDSMIESFVEEPIVVDEVFEDVLGDNLEEDIALENLLTEPEVDVVSELEELDSLLVDTVETEDDILSQLLAAEETPVEEEIDVLAELTKAVEEVPTPAPTPTPADNGGKMGQDDIAALIASMTGGDVAPEPEPMPEPAPTPAPAPADNGGKMNQDDIAALIASMTN